MRNMEKEVVKVFVMQPKEFGERAKENISRLSMYRNKIRRIYDILRVKETTVKVLDGNELVETRISTRREAAQLVTEYGKMFFLDIYYTNTRDAILIRVRGKAPKVPEPDQAA